MKFDSDKKRITMNTQNNKAQSNQVVHKIIDEPRIETLCKENKDLNSKSFDYWLHKNRYYHQQVISFFKFVIPVNSSVLHVNCKNGYLLDAVKPSRAVGIDLDAANIAQAQERYPTFNFYACSLPSLPVKERFDYIMLSLATMEAYDIQDLLDALRPVCHPGTRIIIDSYSALWEPVLSFTQKVGLRRPTEFKNWVSRDDLLNFLPLTGFELVTQGQYMMMPTYIPFISWICNKLLIHIPLISHASLNQWIIARPQPVARNPDMVKVSVVIPCRNEQGNVESAVLRIPHMGAGTEIIFVEGNSTDQTLQEIKRVATDYPEKNISWMVQDGKGKGDAVRKGFAHAKGDILMIQDGDLTAPPEELPKFFDALVQGKGEFINGSRLVYGMEDKAMRFLNLLANFFFGRLFSWLLGQKVKDTLCGTKVLWTHDYKNIVANRAFFGDFDPFGDFDLLFGAAKLNLKIVDMPVHYKNRVYGQTNIRRFVHGWILLGMSMIALKKFKFR